MLGLAADGIRSVGNASKSDWLYLERGGIREERFVLRACSGNGRETRRLCGGPAFARRSNPKAAAISSVLEHPEQWQSDQSAEGRIASLHDVRDGIVGIADRLDIKPKFRNCDAQPASIQGPEVGIRPDGLSPTQGFHGCRVNDNCTRVPRVDEDFQFADPAVCGNQFEAEPRSCGLTPVDVSLFRRRLGHCSYNKMKTSSG